MLLADLVLLEWQSLVDLRGGKDYTRFCVV